MKKLLSLLIIALSFALSACNEKPTTNRIYVFSQPGCVHCEHAHDYIERYYKNYDIREFNIREGENMDYMLRYARKYKIPHHSLGTPLIIMGNNYVMGWGQEQMRDFNRYAKNFKPKSTPQ